MPEVAVGTSTAYVEDFDCFGETRQRVTRIQCAVVRRRGAVARDSSLRPLCMRATNGLYDAYPDHTEGGHLIGLSIGGQDHGHNLVPMFAGFNQVTWKALETQIYQDLTITHVKVVLSYTAADPRKPAQFSLSVRRGGPAWERIAYPHMMDQPSPPAYAIPDGAVDILRTASAEMAEAGWSASAAGLDAGCLPEAGDCIYSVLDYLCLVKPGDFRNLVLALGLGWAGFGIGKGYGFTDLQRALVLRVNYIMHNRSLRSDRYGTVLLIGSTTHAPQVDHVVSMRVSNGYNAFSNAMVISSLENQSKGAKRKHS